MLAKETLQRKWAHKIGKLRGPPTRNIPRLNVYTHCIGKINGADDSSFSYQSEYIISGSKHGRFIFNVMNGFH